MEKKSPQNSFLGKLFLNTKCTHLGFLYMKEHLYLKYWRLRLSLREAYTDETHNSATEEKLLKQ